MHRGAILPILTLLAACGSSGSSATDPTGGTGPGSTDSSPIGGNTGGTLDRSATLTGVTRDASGAPMGDVSVRFCDLQNCRYATSGSDGSFSFGNSYAGWNSLDAVPDAASGLATVYVPLLLASGETREVSISVPPLDPGIALGATSEREVGTGLYITVGAADIEPPLFVEAGTETAGVLVDPSNWIPTDGLTGTVAAQWYVEPFDHHATNGGLPVRIDGATLGLTGASYHMYIGSYEMFGWVDNGSFTDDDADGWYTGLCPLPLLSTIVLVEE